MRISTNYCGLFIALDAHNENKQSNILSRNTADIHELKVMLAYTYFSIFYSENIIEQTETMTDYINFCYDVTFLSTKCHVSPHQLSTPHLKHLRRWKEVFPRMKKYNKVKESSILIKRELKNIYTKFSGDLFSSTNPSHIWKSNKLLTGQKKTQVAVDVDLDQLSAQFTHSPPTSSHHEQLPLIPSIVNPLSQEEVLTAIANLRPSSASGPDKLSPFVLKNCRQELAGAIT